jgi:hypothetical protein
MPKHLEPTEVVEAIESGFSPLECRVELVGQRLGFCVFDVDGNIVLPLSSWNVRWARRPESLRTRINVLRQRVEQEGYTLDPWKALA